MDEHIQEIKDGMTTKSSINSRENLFAEIYKRKAEFACANRKRGVTNSLFLTICNTSSKISDRTTSKSTQRRLPRS